MLALAGEAGIGKTRLARWVVDAARDQRWNVVEGQTHLGLPEPLGVVRDAVRGARRGGLSPAGDDPVAAALPEQLLPELGKGPRDLGGDSGAMFESIIRYFGALSDGAGLLVVLEDLHWADPSSLMLCALLARTVPAGVALVVTFRPDDDSGTGLERLRRELSRTRVREIHVGPLEPEESAEMLTELLGRRPSPDVEAELIRLSGGNPFALEELARAVVDSGWIDPATGVRQTESSLTVPWTLAESIRARSSRLAPAEVDVIRWAAVIGEQFDVRLLSAAAGLDETAVLSALAAGMAAGLVVEDASDPTGNRFAFRHALVHEALMQERLLAERARRHSAVVEAAERLAGEGMDISPVEFARHAFAAGDRRRVVRYGRAAAHAAYEVGAVEEAVEHLEVALARWDPDDGEPMRVDLLLECGRLRARLSRGDERAVELLERARDAALDLGNEATAAFALALLADARFECGQREQALADWQVALAELRTHGPADAVPQALAGQSRGLGLQGEFEAGALVADEGLALLPVATTAEQARVRVSLLTTRGMCDGAQFRMEEARPRLLEAARLAVEYRDDLGAARAHHILGANPLQITPRESRSHFARAGELVRRHGLRGLEAWYTVLEAWATIGAGEWDEAARLLDATETLIDEGERAAWTRLSVQGTRAARLFGLGDLDGAARLWDVAAELAEAIGSPMHRADAEVGIAAIAFVTGDLSRARAGIRTPVDDLLRGSRSLRALELDRWLVVAEVLAATAEFDELEEVATIIRREPGDPWAAYVETLAALDDVAPDDAAARIEATLDAVDARGHVVEAARMCVATSIVLAGRPAGRTAGARLARRAHERFRALGAALWCRLLEQALRELGEPVPRRSGGAGGLTAREIEVLEALASGLTNRGIAERLVISENTAIRHVANIYGKLGAKNRAAAVRIAAERGLISGEDRAELGGPA